MNDKNGLCINSGNCTQAESHQLTRLASGQSIACHECGIDMRIVDSGASRAFNPVQIAGYALGMLSACFMLLWYFSPTPATATQSAAPTPAKSDKMLRFAGSNTIGSELLPALAEAYLKQQGVTEVRRVKGTVPEEMALVDAKNPSPATTIEIAAHGSATSFKALSELRADIGMSSRKIKSGEISKAMQGDLTAPTREHVLALDGVAVIVNRSNMITSLTKEQIAAIFAGVITDWAELKRSPGSINLYARDSKSGTYDTFKSIVLENLTLSNEARLFEDSVMLSERVANDPNGIGFVGLPFVKNAKALAVSESGTTALLPNRLTVATEDYPLARRLFLYTPDQPDNPHVRKFAEFALSKSGQDIVRQHGFIELNVQTSKVAAKSDAPDEYSRLTANAQRLSLNFRFLPGAHKLDNKAVRDMDRVIEFVENARAANHSILLFGFSDSVGDESINLKLSRDRANAVADELTKRGVKLAHVSGYGSSLPVSSNASKEGRDRNRRVEIWIKQ